MKYTSKFLRGILLSMIQKMGEHPEQYVRQSGRDFTRPRTLTFETVISLLLTMSENSIGKILIGQFQNSEKTPSASAFVQQRQKLLPPGKTFCGCGGGRLVAEIRRLLGGPGLLPPRQHGWNLWHMSALFDLENGIYTDLIVQKEHEKNECRALCQMADRSRVSGRVILMTELSVCRPAAAIRNPLSPISTRTGSPTSRSKSSTPDAGALKPPSAT